MKTKKIKSLTELSITKLDTTKIKGGLQREQQVKTNSEVLKKREQ